jgi:prepilin-type N-terminal cleavage/methylation domain-containing protein
MNRRAANFMLRNDGLAAGDSARSGRVASNGFARGSRLPAPGSRLFSGAFTLIELLLAIVIFSMILAAVNAVFFGAMKLRQTYMLCYSQNHFNHIAHQPIPGFVAGEDMVFEDFAPGLAGNGDFRVGGGVGDGPSAIGHDAVLDDKGGRFAAIRRRVPREADPIRALLDMSEIMHLTGYPPWNWIPAVHAGMTAL